MSQADSAEYWMDELIKTLNKLRKAYNMLGEDASYLTALDDVAEEMGVTIQKVYVR